MPLKDTLKKLLDILFPRHCEICSSQVDRFDRYICANCLNNLPFMPQDGCAICAKPISSGGNTNLLCEDCSGKNRPFFDRAAAAVCFEGNFRRILLDFKFNSHLWLKNDFIDLLESAARSRLNMAAVDLIIPMPITTFHLLDRGFNQSALLAKALAKRINKSYSNKILRRINSPRRQSGLKEEDRRENVKNTFKVLKPRKVIGRVILVVDDIMTTGATLSECARTLKSAGAQKVFVLTLATTLRS
ncbi:MAG: ComF family protein [Kiritimatiellae bacterium]|nr:ComF family protein [Kiritimatiellia bacterium]